MNNDLDFIRKALNQRWLFWLYFWRIPKLLKIMCDEMERVWSNESRIVKERDDSIKANKSLLQWVHVTHRLGTTPDAIKALFAAGKRLRVILFFAFASSLFAAGPPPPLVRNYLTTNQTFLQVGALTNNGLDGWGFYNLTNLANSFVEIWTNNGTYVTIAADTNRVRHYSGFTVFGPTNQPISLTNAGMIVMTRNPVTSPGSYGKVSSGMAGAFFFRATNCFVSADDGSWAGGLFDGSSGLGASNCFARAFDGGHAGGLFDFSVNSYTDARGGSYASANFREALNCNVSADNGSFAGGYIKNTTNSYIQSDLGSHAGGYISDEATNSSIFASAGLSIGILPAPSERIYSRGDGVGALAIGRDVASIDNWSLGIHGTNTTALSLALINNGIKFLVESNGTISSDSLTASTVLSASSDKKISSISNGTGALTNNGSGGLGWFSGYAPASGGAYIANVNGFGTNTTFLGNITNITTTATPTFMTIRPPDGHGSNLFYMAATAAANAGNASRSNAGFAFGHNFSGSGRVISTEPAFGWVFEGHYEPTTNLPQYETYFQIYKTNGESWRPFGYVVGKNAGSTGGRIDFHTQEIHVSNTNVANEYMTLNPLGQAGGDGGLMHYYGTILLHNANLSSAIGVLMDEATKIRFRDTATTNIVDVSMSETNLLFTKASTVNFGNVKFSAFDSLLLDPASLVLVSNVTNQVRYRIGSGNDAVIERMAGSAAGSLLVSNWTDIYFSSATLRQVPAITAPAGSGIALYAGSSQAVQLFANGGNQGWLVNTSPGQFYPNDDGSQDLGLSNRRLKDGYFKGSLYVSNSIYCETNLAPFDIAVTDFTIDTWYTNGDQRASVVLSFELDANTTGTAKAGLYIDQAKDGTFETTITVQSTGLTDAIQSVVTGWLQPGARFAITNLSSGTGSPTAAVVAGSCQWVKQ